MKRRQFIKALGIGTAAIAAPGILFADRFKLWPRSETLVVNLAKGHKLPENDHQIDALSYVIQSAHKYGTGVIQVNGKVRGKTRRILLYRISGWF